MREELQSNWLRRAVPFAIVLVVVLWPAPVNWLGAAYAQSQNQTGTGPSQNPGLPNGLGPGEVTPPPLPPDIDSHLSQKQKDAIIKANFRSTQRDVEKLNTLVQSLRAQLKKSNANVLSLHIVAQAGKIEKLARKIKNESKSY